MEKVTSAQAILIIVMTLGAMISLEVKIHLAVGLTSYLRRAVQAPIQNEGHATLVQLVLHAMTTQHR